MTEGSKSPRKPSPSFAENIGAKAARKQRAKRRAGRSVWFGLGMMGVVGWSVAIPTLLGTALGIWLDERYPREHAWTIALLVLGLAIGCFLAWHWVAKEHRAIREEDEHGDD